MSTAIARVLERFLLPNACVACGRGIEAHRPDALVCGVCRTRMLAIRSGCARCGQPLPPVGPCRFCADWPAALRRVRSAVWLDETATALVHHLKYEGLPTLGAAFADLIVRHVPRPADAAALVPIPLAPARARRRGYNQAAAIAHALGPAWRLPVAEQVLSRTRDTATQTALTPEARARNVAGAFVATRPPQRTAPPPASPASSIREERAGGSIILVDDVLTTGATLCAAADALVDAGWPSVGAVTFARALPYELRAAS